MERRGYVLVIASAASFAVLPGMAAYAASKAGAEQFANALRLEVAHKGVRVGSAHPSWIDTDLVRDQRAELETFARALAQLPWPMRSTTSVQECADALVDGIARRRRRIYVPRALVIVQALRSLFTGPAAELLIRRRARTLVPELEAEITRLGRWFGASSVALPATPATADEPRITERPA